MSTAEKMMVGAAAWVALSVLVGLGFGRWMKMCDRYDEEASDEPWEPLGWQVHPVTTNVIAERQFTEPLKSDETLSMTWTLNTDKLGDRDDFDEWTDEIKTALDKRFLGL